MARNKNAREKTRGVGEKRDDASAMFTALTYPRCRGEARTGGDEQIQGAVDDEHKGL